MPDTRSAADVGSAGCASNSPSYDSPLTFATGQYPTPPLLVDIDNDGDTDIAVADTGAKQVAVLINDGSGNYPLKKTVTLRVANALLAGDVDRDGDIDLVVGSQNTSGSAIAQILTNDGAGNLTAGQQVDINLGAPVALVDVDLDGDLDLLNMEISGNSEQLVLRRNNAGVFGLRENAIAIGNASQPFVLSGDIDGDGDLDLIYNNYGGGTVLLNNGTGKFAATATPVYPSQESAAALGDLDGDHDLDVVTVDTTSMRMYVYQNDGGGVFATASNFPTGNYNDSVALEDLDGDGDLDALVPNRMDSTVAVLLNNGLGQFSMRTIVSAGTTSPQYVAVGKVHQSCNPDVVLVDNTNSVAEVLLSSY